MAVGVPIHPHPVAEHLSVSPVGEIKRLEGVAQAAIMIVIMPNNLMFCSNILKDIFKKKWQKLGETAI